MTEIDDAHARMEASPENDTLRLSFYEQLADSEVSLLLGGDVDGDQITPEIFELDGGSYVLIFDTEERLSDFTGRVVPYAAMPGRALVQMLEGQGVGIGLNLRVAPSAMLIPSDAVDWLAGTLANAPEETQARLTELRAPVGIPEPVLSGLDRKLSKAAGLARHAYLAAALYENGEKGHVLAFVDTADGSEKALAHAAGEALTFSGIEAGVMDVMFCTSEDAVAQKLAAVAVRFDIPELAERPAPIAPGSDPDVPPKLK